MEIKLKTTKLKSPLYSRDFAERFKKNYKYTMGGTQTIVMPNNQRFYFDDEEYYKGSGRKYNNSIKHHQIGEVIITKKEVADLKRLDRENAKKIRLDKQMDKILSNLNKRKKEFEKENNINNHTRPEIRKYYDAPWFNPQKYKIDISSCLLALNYLKVISSTDEELQLIKDFNLKNNTNYSLHRYEDEINKVLECSVLLKNLENLETYIAN